MSGIVSTFVATPPDVVKTRILSQDALTKQRQKQQSLPILQPPPALLEANDDQANNGLPPLATPSSSSILTNPGKAATSTSLSATLPGRRNEKEIPSTSNTARNMYKNQGSTTAILKTPSATVSTNPWIVAQSIVEREGYKVLFSGAKERCIGAIPRFGITLGMHEWLEHYAATVGLLPPIHHL